MLGGRIFACFKGPRGFGKTVAEASFPGPMYFFDCDGRMDPVKLMFPHRTDIDYDTYTAGDFLKFDKKCSEIRAAPDRYKTYVGSSLTSLARMLLQYSLTVRGEDADAKDAAKKQLGRHKGIIKLYDIEDFGTESRGLNQILDFFRTLKNSHFILEAHETTIDEKNRITGEQWTERTLLTGGKKIAKELPGYFNEVWHFNQRGAIDASKQPQFLCRMQSTGEDWAKTALPFTKHEFDFTQKPGEVGKGLFQLVAADLAKAGIVLAGAQDAVQRNEATK
jgi:AAA domain